MDNLIQLDTELKPKDLILINERDKNFLGLWIVADSSDDPATKDVFIDLTRLSFFGNYSQFGHHMTIEKQCLVNMLAIRLGSLGN